MAKNLDQATARRRLLSMPPEERARLLRNCGEWRHPIQHVLIDDMPLDRYGKRFHCLAPAMVEMALSRLSKLMV